MKKTIAFLSQIFNRKTKWVSIYLPILILGVFFYLTMMGNVYSQTYDVERFDRAKETIRSPITVENEAETERKTRETILAVTDRYTIVEEVTNDQLNYLEEIFAAIDTLLESEKENRNDKEKEPTNDDQLAQLQEVLSSDITDNVDDLVFMQLIRLDKKE